MSADILEEGHSRHRHRTRTRSWAETAAYWLFALILLWAPFPLGSNRPWSWSLLVFLLAGCWSIWSFSVWNGFERPGMLSRVRIPLILAGLALLWGLIQCAPWAPGSWIHPVWRLGGEVLHRPLQGAISLNPWSTITEVMKLGTYLATAMLAYAMSQHSDRARRLLHVLMVIGAFYAAYGLALGVAGITQEQLMYNTLPTGSKFAGPFVSRNNFATFAGLSVIAATIALFDLGGRTLIIGRGVRELAASAIYFMFGAGAVPVAAFLVSVFMLVASGSRAGFMACLVGLAALIGFGGLIAGRSNARKWAVGGAVVLAATVAVLFMVTGNDLQSRLDELADTGFDETRLLLWQAATRMIADAPILGIGLGTYEQAYPLYADRVLPFVMDKAHNDYLELAAGLGIPAALAWWTACSWLLWLCVRALFIRHRNRHFPLFALGAAALVGFHSFFDFSLQIPAVAIYFAAILGLGVAQSEPTRHSARDGLGDFHRSSSEGA